MEEQVVAIYAGINGFLDEIPVAQVPRFQDALREHMQSEKSVLDDIREGKDLPDELAERLNAEIEKVKRGFNVEESDSLVGAGAGS
jgi:F-type H+-transporting ATPase subunit alpha